MEHILPWAMGAYVLLSLGCSGDSPAGLGDGTTYTSFGPTAIVRLGSRLGPSSSW